MNRNRRSPSVLESPGGKKPKRKDRKKKDGEKSKKKDSSKDHTQSTQSRITTIAEESILHHRWTHTSEQNAPGCPFDEGNQIRCLLRNLRETYMDGGLVSSDALKERMESLQGVVVVVLYLIKRNTPPNKSISIL